jgi:ribosomal protein S18 acetylase RimI-like enzyme
MRYSINKGLDYVVYKIGHNSTIEIEDIAVTSERRVGYGTRLINHLKKRHCNLYAFMRVSNDTAYRFYLKNGFKPTLVRNFYPDENAYLMLWWVR